MSFLAILPIRTFSRETVGLVLSGGGAKGITHVGVIKALEDNEIPIDYITGTSMGAIVGALYATGYSPEDMLALFSSKNFYQAYSGDLSDIPFYEFRRSAPTPEFIDFTLSMNGVKQIAVGITGFSLVDPAAMNLNFFELFAPASLSASNDFNNLFVPFRCIGSDIYRKKEIIFSEGNLAYALQVSMSIPFYFKPQVDEDKKVLIDGGVYDNLPIKPMKETFHPDFIIASMAANSDKPHMINDDIGEFFVNMILQRDQYNLSENEGLMIDLVPDEVGMMDFEKVQQAYMIGYRKGLLMVDSIRKHVTGKVSRSELDAARHKYKSRLPEMSFQEFHISGVTDEQQLFFEKFFWRDKSVPYSMSAFKEDYLNFFAGNDGVEMVPTVSYDSIRNMYSLNLNTRLVSSPQIALGGNISSMSANQLYLGLRLNRFSTSVFKHKAHIYLGNTLNAVALTSDWNTQQQSPVYYQFMAAYNYFRYCDPHWSFFEYSKPLFNQRETFAKMKMILPFYKDSRLESSLGIGYLEDHYSVFDANTAMTLPENHSIYTLGKARVAFTKMKLNHKLFPTSGEKYNLSASYHLGRESFRQKDHNSYREVDQDNFNYYSTFFSAEKYFPLNYTIQLKGLLSAQFSNKPLFNNYESTVIQSTAFTPTGHSLIAFNSDLRANNYLALGFTPIVKLNSTAHFRFENYYFMPIKPILKDNLTQKVYYGDPFSHNTWFSEVSFVYNLPILSISLFGNYYSRAESHFNFGINIGYLIFNERFLNN